MFKKLRDKITEEVQQSTLRLPVSLSAFGGVAGENDSAQTSQNTMQDEMLVDISDIQPAGDNKDLFSIGEESEGSPCKSSDFQVIELGEETTSPELETPEDSQLNAINLSPPAILGSIQHGRKRRTSDSSSNIDGGGGLFPIYEVPGVSFNLPQSDLESVCSEYEDNSSLDRVSKDTVYQAYIRTRQRYQKYKGRYSDIAAAYREKERETEKLRDVLTKTQDKAVRRLSELREQCLLEKQAKAHLEEELRSDMEEKDHKIETLQTKIRLLQEGCLSDLSIRSINDSRSDENENASMLSEMDVSAKPEYDSGCSPRIDDSDNVSMGSLGSISTAHTSLEADELIDKLKSDLVKHKSLLSRCMENIRINKERMQALSKEKEQMFQQLQEKIKYLDDLKVDHSKELELLKEEVESSALSMAETKQQLFKELQIKEAEVTHYKARSSEFEEELESVKEELVKAEESLRIREMEEIEINQSESSMHSETDVRELEHKCTELENLVADLQSSKKKQEIELEDICSMSSMVFTDMEHEIIGNGYCNNSESSEHSDFNSSTGNLLKDSSDHNLSLMEKLRKTNSDYEEFNKKYKITLDQKNILEIDFNKLKIDLSDLSLKNTELNDENAVINNKLKLALEAKNQLNLEYVKHMREFESLSFKLDNLKLENADLREITLTQESSIQDLMSKCEFLEEQEIQLNTETKNLKIKCDKEVNNLKQELKAGKEAFNNKLEENEKNNNDKMEKLNNSHKAELLSVIESREQDCSQVNKLHQTLLSKNELIQNMQTNIEKLTNNIKLESLLKSQFENIINSLQSIIVSHTGTTDIENEKLCEILRCLLDEKECLENKHKELEESNLKDKEKLLNIQSEMSDAEGLTKEIDKLKVLNEDLAKRLRQAEDSYIEECEKYTNTMERKLSIIKNLEVELSTVKNTLNNEREKLGRENKLLKSSKNEIQERLSKLKDCEQDKERKLIILQDNHVEITKRLTELKDNVDSMQKENKELRILLSDKENFIENSDREFRNKHDALENEVERVLSENKELRDNIEIKSVKFEEQMKDVLARNRDTKKLHEQEIERLLNDVEDNERKVAVVVAKLNDEKSRIKELTLCRDNSLEKINLLEQKVDDLENNISEIETSHCDNLRHVNNQWENKLKSKLDDLQQTHESGLVSALARTEASNETLVRSRESEIAELKDLCQKLRMEAEKNEESVKELEEEVSRTKEDLQVKEEELAEDKRKLIDAEGNVASLEEEKREDVEKIEEMRKTIEEKESKEQELQSSLEVSVGENIELESARNEVKVMLDEKMVSEGKISQQVDELSSKLESKEKELREVLEKSKIDENTLKINEDEIRKLTLENNQSVTIKEELGKELKNKQDELTSLLEINKNNTDNLKEMEEQIETLKNEKLNNEKKIESMAKLEEQNIEMGSLNNKLKESEDNLNRVNEELSKLKQMEVEHCQQIDGLQAEVGKFSDHKIEQLDIIGKLNVEKSEQINLINKLNCEKCELSNIISQLNQEKFNIIERLNSERTDIINTVSKLKAEIAEKCDVIDRLNGQLSLSGELNDSNSRMREEIQRLLSDKLNLETQIQTIQSEKSSFENRVNDLESEKSILGNKLKDMQSEKSSFEDKVNNSQSEKIFFKNQIKELQSEKFVFEDQIKILHSERLSFESQVNNLHSELSSNKKQIELLQSEKSAFENQIQIFQSEKSSLENQVKLLQSEKSSFENQVQILQSEKSSIENQVQILQSEKSSIENQVQILQSEKSFIVNQVQILQSEKSSIENQVQILQSEKSSIASQNLTLQTESSKGEFEFAAEKQKFIELLQGVEEEKEKQDEDRLEILPNDDIEKVACTHKKLLSKLDMMKEQMENSRKLIVLLEFNIVHHKAKVANMKLSNDCLVESNESLQAKLEAQHDLNRKEYDDLQQRLSTEKNELDQRLRKEKEELDEDLSLKIQNLEESLAKGEDEIRANLIKERTEMEERLTKDKVEIEERLKKELEELKQSRDSEILSLNAMIEGFKDVTGGHQKQISQIEENNAGLQQKMVMVQEQRDEARKLIQKLEVEKSEVVKSLKNSEENFQKQTVELNEMKEEVNILTKQLEEVIELSTRYKEKLESTTKNVENVQAELDKQKLTISQLNKEVRESKDKYNNILKDANEVPELKNRNIALEKQSNDLESSNRSLSESLAKSNTECSSLKDDLCSVKIDLEKKQKLIDVYLSAFKKLNALSDPSKTDESGELDVENIVKILAIERQEMGNKMKSKENEIVSLRDDFEKEKGNGQGLVDKVAKKEEEISLMWENSAKSSAEHLKSFEELRKELSNEHKTKVSAVIDEWKDKSSQMVLQREIELQERMDELTEEWTNERKELERITQVASAAFKSGTESVDLLKKQVSAQRNEIDQMKFKHRNEISELQALLEVKRRRKAGIDNRIGGSLEDSAEFEYLQNVLYQYMVGKETKTLSKVLCAVVKFDKDQQAQVREAEERRQNALREINGDDTAAIDDSKRDSTLQSRVIKCT